MGFAEPARVPGGDGLVAVTATGVVLAGCTPDDVVVVDAGFTEIAPGSATVMVTGGRYSGGGAGAGV